MKPTSSKQPAPFELNGSTLRTLLKDIRDGQISDEDERIHAMHSLPFVQRYVAETGIAELNKTQTVFRAIDQLWLKRHRPKRLTDQLSEEWLKFIFPEYIYFYPVRHNTFASPSISQALIELCDEDILVHSLLTELQTRSIGFVQRNLANSFWSRSRAMYLTIDWLLRVTRRLTRVSNVCLTILRPFFSLTQVRFLSPSRLSQLS